MPAALDVPSSVRDLTLDLTSLASNVMWAASLPADGPAGEVRGTAIRLWEVVTGLSGQAALDVADAIQRHPVPVTAAVVPF